MVKKKSNAIAIILFIAIGVFIANYYGLFEGTLSPFAITNVVLNEGTTDISPYVCSNEADFCQASGKMVCDTPSGQIQELVTFRTNAVDEDDYENENKWIAIGENGFLKGYVSTRERSTLATTCTNCIGKIGKTSHGNCILERKSKVHVCVGSLGWVYEQDTRGVAVLTSTPKEPYSSNGQERKTVVSTQEKVIFRTNASQSVDVWHRYVGDWLAIDTGGGLKSYRGIGGGYIDCQREDTTLVSFKSLEGHCICIDAEERIIIYWNKESCRSGDNAWIFELDPGLADLTSFPIEPYTSNGLEIIVEDGGGGDIYSCTAQVKIDNDLQQTLTHSGNSPATKTSRQYTLQPNEEFEVTGGDSIEIDFREIEQVTTCTTGRRICEGNIVTECQDNDYVAIETCDVGCDDGECINAYEDFEVTIKDNFGNEKNFFKPSEKIVITTNTVASPQISGSMIFTLVKGNVDGDIFYTEQTSFTSGVSNTFTFENGIPITGDFYIVVSLSYSGQTDVIGKKLDELEEIKIRRGIVSTSTAKQFLQGIDYTVRNKFWLGYPVEITFHITDEATTPVNPTSGSVFYKIGNGQSMPLTQSTSESSTGNLVYLMNPNQEGEYTVTGTFDKNGFSTVESITFSMNKEVINMKFSTLNDNVKVGTTEKVRLELENQDGELISPDSLIVTATELGVQTIVTTVNEDSTGKYSFDYTYTKTGGYSFEAKALFSSSLIDNPPALKSKQIFSSETPDPDDDCEIDDDCGFLQRCNEDNTCATRIDLIIIIFGAIFGAIILIIIILRVLKSGRQPRFNGGGL